MQLSHQQTQPHQQPQPSPLASPENVRQERSLAISCDFMRELEEGLKVPHSLPEGGVRAPQYVEIRDSQYVPTLSPSLHEEDRLTEEPSAPSRTNGGRDPGAAALGDFMAVA